MKGLILCGGLGERLWPYTKSFPKSLMPLLDRPLIASTIERYRAAGVTEILINSLANIADLTACLGDGSALGVNIHYLQEPFRLGTGGALYYAKDFWGSDDLLVSVSDMVSSLNFREFLAFHATHADAVSVAAMNHPWDPADFHGDVIVLGDNVRAVEYQFKPKGSAKSRVAATGAWVLRPAVKQNLPEPRADMIDAEGVDLNRDILPGVTKSPSLRLSAFVRPQVFYDFGLPEGYIEGSLLALEGEFGVVPGLPERAPGQFVAASASIAPDCRVERSVLVDQDAVISSGTQLVGPVVVGAGATIGAGAIIRSSVILPGAEVAPGSVVLRSLIGATQTPETVRKYYFAGRQLKVEGAGSFYGHA